MTFLTYVAAEIRESGWVPKSAHDPEGGKFATVFGALGSVGLYLVFR